MDMENEDLDYLIVDNVQQFPCLWNKNAEGYKNKNSKINAYKFIADKLSIEVNYVESRWLVLRKKYSRERKMRNSEVHSSSGKVSRRIWPLYDKLSFLNQHVWERRSSAPVMKKPLMTKDLNVFTEAEDAKTEPSTSQNEDTLISNVDTTIENGDEPIQLTPGTSQDGFHFSRASTSNSSRSTSKNKMESELINAASAISNFFEKAASVSLTPVSGLANEDVTFLQTICYMLEKKSKKKKKEARMFILNYVQNLTSDEDSN